MRGRDLLRWPVLVMTLIGLVGSADPVAAQPRERLEYWRAKYQELAPTADPRAARAHAIFRRLVEVAGRRYASMIPLPVCAIREGSHQTRRFA